ncbi:MAG: FecR domain-containing protein [Alphaproteobacteria bacterium]|nr:FecR domain-containing protein [Alphaproteobacteria bacterium]
MPGSVNSPTRSAAASGTIDGPTALTPETTMERVACSGVDAQRKAADGGCVASWAMRLAIAFCMLAGAIAPVAAQQRASWVVVESSGRAEILVSGAQPVSLRAGGALAGGEQVRTGSDGRVVLRRGGDTLIVAPDSAVALPADADGMFTRVLQLIGSLIVRVEARKDGAFEVRTPYLVAVVKGTLFAVSIDALGGSVHVAEGRVEVTDLAGSPPVLLGIGERVHVTAGQRPSLQPAPATVPSLPSLERVTRDVAAGSAGLLAIEGAAVDSGAVMSGGGGAETALTRPDPPAAAVLHGLGGNRARFGGPSVSGAPVGGSSGAGGGVGGIGGGGGGGIGGGGGNGGNGGGGGGGQ